MPLTSILQSHRADLHPVVPFDAGRDKLYAFDFTDNNTALSPDEIADTERFADWINRTLRQNQARYGIGGYGEHRTLYGRSKHFDRELNRGSGSREAGKAGSPEAGGVEPRRLHLGIDIWGPAGTKVMAPLNGIVHSFAFNNNDSDYGATLILTHNLDGVGFHTLYGHLSLNSLKNLTEGKNIRKGEVIGEFGMRFENGNWPPHLHFQLIADMQGWKGDYPGVCRFSERQQWLANCPDPNLILQLQA
ncbi:peptidoglycan DD-metalloendopeptidase family protein [Puia sp.]|jgi:murein DD-endopeptidase MepM/ murein hydrolase activator NlpD|uniref:peptidoglycan DD-metalloendopeptidase family protein n=1 Tax=Puia sp. TaxID=2045100 RepID=UPI002F411EC6